MIIEIVASQEVGERLRVLIVWWRLRVFELYSNQKVGHKLKNVNIEWNQTPHCVLGTYHQKSKKQI